MRGVPGTLAAGALAGALAAAPGAAEGGCVYPIPTADGGARAQVSHAIAELSRAVSLAGRIQSGVEGLNSVSGLRSLLSLGGVALPAPDLGPLEGVGLARLGEGKVPWQAIASGLDPEAHVAQALRSAGLRMDGGSAPAPDPAALARLLAEASGIPGAQGTADEIRLYTGIAGGDARHRLGTLADAAGPALRDALLRSLGADRDIRLAGLGDLDLTSVAAGGAWRMDALPGDGGRGGRSGSGSASGPRDWPTAEPERAPGGGPVPVRREWRDDGWVRGEIERQGRRLGEGGGDLERPRPVWMPRRHAARLPGRPGTQPPPLPRDSLTDGEALRFLAERHALIAYGAETQRALWRGGMRLPPETPEEILGRWRRTVREPLPLLDRTAAAGRYADSAERAFEGHMARAARIGRMRHIADTDERAERACREIVEAHLRDALPEDGGYRGIALQVLAVCDRTMAPEPRRGLAEAGPESLPSIGSLRAASRRATGRTGPGDGDGEAGGGAGGMGDIVLAALSETEAGGVLEDIRRATGAGLWDVLDGYVRKIGRPGAHEAARREILSDGMDGLRRHPLVRDSEIAGEALRQLGRVSEGRSPYLQAGRVLSEAGFGGETRRLLRIADERARTPGGGGPLRTHEISAIAEAAGAAIPVGINGRVAAACFQAEGCPGASPSARGVFGVPSPTWLGREARRRALLDAALSGAGVPGHAPGSLARDWLDGVGGELSRQHSCATGDTGHRTEAGLGGRAAPAASGGGGVPTDALYLDRGTGRAATELVRTARRDHLLSTALDAWGTARSERGRMLRLEARQRTLAERLEACGDLACDMRVAADAARIRAEEMRRMAELQAEALRLAQARAVKAQPLHRTGAEKR